MKGFVESGDTFDYTLEADASPDDIVIKGDLVGVLVNGGSVGDVVAAKAKGVYWQPKGNGAIEQGDPLYLNATDGTLTKTETGNAYVGCAHVAAASGDAMVQLRLKG